MARLRELPAYRRLPCFPAAAAGAELVLADGGRVLDLYGGHCVNTLGAGDAGLLRAIERQWRTLSFATNLFDVGARDELLEAFAANLPEGAGDWSTFLGNSGAEANENALKAALSAHGESERSVVVAFADAFHGRTAAAEAVSDRRGSYPRAPFDVRRLAFGDAAALETGVTDDVAAVILEPIQSLAGVVVPPPGWLELVRARCDAVGALLVFDEVQTGNGRLGTPWAAQRFGVVPDIFTTAKGAAGGLPIGLTVLRQDVAARVDPTRFGSTFGGGPTVLAAATEVARRIAAPGFLANVRDAGEALRDAALHGPVVAVRGEGLLLGLVLEEGLAAATVRDHLLAAGVLVGTSNDPRVLRLSPPLTLRPKEAARLGEAFAALRVEPGVRVTV